MGEESSLRAELEALIHAYTIIPAGIDVIHAVDNMTAIDIHSMLQTSGLRLRLRLRGLLPGKGSPLPSQLGLNFESSSRLGPTVLIL